MQREPARRAAGGGDRPAPSPTPSAAAETADIYRLLVEHVEGCAIFLLDPEGRVATWNAGAGAVNGYAAAEVMGQGCDMFYPPGDRAAGKPRRLLDEALRRGRVGDEGWWVRKDGTRFWAEVVLTAIHDRGGQHRGFASVARDLTERRAAEEAVQESEKRLRHLVDSVKDYALYTLDTRGRISSWNAGAERTKGYPAADVLGRSFELFFLPEDRAAGKPGRLLREALRDGRVEDEGWRVRKDGTRFWADAILTTISDDEGRHRGFAKVTRDLTERRAAEQAKAAAERMSELARMKTQFINTVSHELRTPLTPAMLQLEVLRGERKDWSAQERRAFDILTRSLQRLALLVEDVLEVGRLDSGRLTLLAGPMDLAQAARNTAASFREAAAEKGLSLLVEATGPANLVADDRRVGQVLYHLVSNALRFTPRGGTVRIGVLPDGAGWKVEVHDTGVGLTAAQRDRLFQPFGLVHDKDPGNTGTGLGLYLSRGLVEAHGGRIWATSAGPGKGSTFTFTLPPSPAPPPAEARAGAALRVGTASL